MHRIATCVFLVLTLLLPAFQLAAAATGIAAPNTKKYSTTAFITLRQAVKSGQLFLKISGDGHTTSTVSAEVTNKSNAELNVVVPAHEVLLSKNPSIQHMMITRDRVFTVPANASIQLNLSTMCVSTRSVPPPQAEATEFEVGAYPGGNEVWQELANIMEEAHLLARTGTFDNVKIPAERRENTLAQLAIWLFLGKRDGKAESQVTRESIGQSVLDQRGLKRDDLNDQQRKQFDESVDNIFLAADLTMKNAKSDTHARELATLPTDSPFDTFMQVGQRALNDGSIIEAAELLAAAVDEAQSFNPTDPRLATSLFSLASCYLFQGKSADAAPIFKRSIEIREKALGPEYSETAEAVTGLAQSLVSQQRNVEAVPLFERALQIREKSAGKDSPLVADAALNLGRAYMNLGRQGEAETALRRALALRVKAFGLNTLVVAEVDKNLADLYTLEGDFSKAEDLYKRAHSITVDKSARKDKDPFVCAILDGMANMYRRAKQEQQADAYSQEADKLKDDVLGDGAYLTTAIPASYVAYQKLAALKQDNLKIGVSTSGPSVAVNKPIRDKWALVVGISNYHDREINLNYSAKDAKDFADFLVKDENFSADHVHVLVDDQATQRNIMAELGDNWLTKARPDDLVLIYVSGHGSPSAADIRGSNFLIAYDTDKKNLMSTGIRMDTLGQTIKDRVHSNRIVLILDACHSGNVTPGVKDLVRHGGFDAEKLAQGTGQMVICSSAYDQSSYESKKYPNGIFTHCLIERLKKNGPKAAVDDAFMRDLKNDVCDASIADWGEKQEPLMQTRWKGTQLILGAPPTDPVHGIKQ
ncbi:MAG TPA: tetratricopeptide repeat protein [Candidatus Obscuribacterales bacterium]